MWRTAKVYNFKTKKFEKKKIWEREMILLVQKA